MVTNINVRTQMITDLSTCSEIIGAVAVDLDTGEVSVRERVGGRETLWTMMCPQGARIVRRV